MAVSVPAVSCPLDRLPLSNRSLRRLKENGYRTADQVAAASDEELLALPGFGETCLAEVRAALGLAAPEDAPRWPDPSSFPAEQLGRPVSELPISNRARRVFERAGIEKVADLLRLGPDGLLALPAFGEASLANVARALAACAAVREPAAPAEQWSDLPVERLDLPRGAIRPLRRLHVRTVGDLARLDPRDLLRHRNFGPASLRRVRAEIERVRAGSGRSDGALGDALEALLDRLRPREREVVELREGIDPAGPLSLAEIGRRLSLTESRICQIEHAAWRKLRRFAPESLELFVPRLVARVTAAGGVVRPEELRLDSDLHPGPFARSLARLLARLAPHAFARLSDGRLAAAPAATVQTLVVRLRKRIGRGSRPLSFDEIAREVLRGTGLGAHGPALVRALLETTFGREVCEGPDGTERVRTPAQGFLDDAERVLQEAGGPLHFTEIARRLTLPPFLRPDADGERVRLRLCRDDRFVLVERGRYDLRRRLDIDAKDRERWASAALEELRRIGRPASAAVLRRRLARGEGPPPPSESLMQRLLREDRRFAHVGRGAFAPAGSARRVERVSQLLERALREAGGPLPYSELRRRVQEVRRVSDGSISATLVSRDLFVRIRRGLFDLAERHPFATEARRRIARAAVAAIRERGGVASLVELARIAPWPEQAPVRTPVLLGDLLRRSGGFRLLRGGFVAEAGSPLEEELLERARRELAAAGRPLGVAQLAARLHLGRGARELLREALRGDPVVECDERGRFRPRAAR